MNGPSAVKIALLFLVVGWSQMGAAQIVDYGEKTDVVRCIELSGAVQAADQMFDIMVPAMMDMLKSGNPDIPERALEIARDVIKTELQANIEGPGGLISRMVPVYEKYYTPEEIRGLIAFFESPLGKKMVAIMPALMQEGALIGQQWAGDLMVSLEEKMHERLSREGYLK